MAAILAAAGAGPGHGPAGVGNVTLPRNAVRLLTVLTL
jgi:hypothetical protein